MPIRSTDRRAVLVAVGAAAVAAIAGRVSAQAAHVGGRVAFQGGAVVPEGRLEIYVDDPAVPDRSRGRGPRTRLASDGKSTAIDFSLTSPGPASPTSRIVVRLERADGWLLARGSARLEAGSPVEVTLNAVAY